jgi:hypothetical protein
VVEQLPADPELCESAGRTTNASSSQGEQQRGLRAGRISNAVPPRSTVLVHRARHAQGDGGEESVERRDAGGRRPGGGPLVRGQRLERGPARSGSHKPGSPLLLCLGRTPMPLAPVPQPMVRLLTFKELPPVPQAHEPLLNPEIPNLGPGVLL